MTSGRGALVTPGGILISLLCSTRRAPIPGGRRTSFLCTACRRLGGVGRKGNLIDVKGLPRRE